MFFGIDYLQTTKSIGSKRIAAAVAGVASDFPAANSTANARIGASYGDTTVNQVAAAQ